MLDKTTRQAVVRIASEAQELFGADLVSIVLYGSAAGKDFVAGKSDLNIAIVLDKVRFEHLRGLNTRLPGWHELGAAMPLLLDRKSLEQGRDVFPMEFQDIKEMHELLAGEDVFANLDIDWRNLRYQAEHEVRGKLLRLRALYAELGNDSERLQRLLVDSVKTFLIVMRSLVRLHQRQSSASYFDVLDQFETRMAAKFPEIRNLLEVKIGRRVWPQDTEVMVRGYLSEVERLTDLLDGVQPEGA